MPSIAYRCVDCHLTFVVGLFHYRGLVADYESVTLCVCATCGTTHAIEHTERDTLKDRLFYIGGPYHDGDDMAEDEQPGVLMLQWYRAPPVLSDWISAGLIHRKAVPHAKCVHCHSKPLVTSWGDDKACPSCGGKMEVAGGCF